MMKRETPKGVTLPNGRTFVARYKCVTCDHLPAYICLERSYKQRLAPCGKRRKPRGLQQGWSLGSILKLAKKVFKTQIV